jgi:hypothetical protein
MATLIPVDGQIMLCQRRGELMRAVIFRHEIQKVRRRGIERRPNGVCARIGNRAWREADYAVRIIGRRLIQISSPQIAVEGGHAIDDGGVALQWNTFAQAIVEHGGNQLALRHRLPFLSQ